MLRIRRLCKRTQSLTDDYLRNHPRSLNQHSIKVNSPRVGESEEEKVKRELEPSLESFLLSDQIMCIQLPVSRFKLDFLPEEKAWQHPLIPEFLQKYGNQIKHLEIYHMTLPMDKAEFQFYEQLPNLRSLSMTSLNAKEITFRNVDCGRWHNFSGNI